MQTAVELLLNELEEYDFKVSPSIRKRYIEMEKQQIIDAYWGGLNGSINDYSIAKEVGSEIIDIRYGKGAEQYYNETYGSDETNGNNVEEVPNVSNATEINWGGVVQHIPNICNCHQSNCHLINGKYICASCNKTLNVETSSLMDSHLVDFSNKNAHLIKSNSTIYSQTEISETEEYTSCPICNGTSINGFCSTPNCAYSLYEPNKDDLEMTPTFSQTEISEIEKESYIKFPILTYSVMEGHDDLNRHLRDSWVEGIKWYREQLKLKR